MSKFIVYIQESDSSIKEIEIEADRYDRDIDPERNLALTFYDKVDIQNEVEVAYFYSADVQGVKQIKQ